MPVWDVIDTPHEQSNVIRAAGVLCSHPLLISADNNDHRHCAFKRGHMNGLTNVGTLPAGPTMLGLLIMSRPIIFVPVTLVPARCPTIVAPSIPIVRRLAVRGPSPVPAHPIWGRMERGSPPAAATAVSRTVVIISLVIAVVRMRKW